MRPPVRTETVPTTPRLSSDLAELTDYGSIGSDEIREVIGVLKLQGGYISSIYWPTYLACNSRTYHQLDRARNSRHSTKLPQRRREGDQPE